MGNVITTIEYASCFEYNNEKNAGKKLWFIYNLCFDCDNLYWCLEILQEEDREIMKIVADN